ncbi:MAG: cation:proton antiporter [Rhodospirillales bacterium]|nr:cation:proton antiporter [Rhodospirillales bacterium]
MAQNSHLLDVLVLLTALLVFVPLFQWLHIGTVLGYLAAGVVIGPSLLGLISDVEGAEVLGEFGVVFLLFAIGLELKPDRLRLFGPKVFGLGLAQFLVTTVVLSTIARVSGLDTTAALLVGATLALSSTAVVLQLLGERVQMTRALGRVALAILLVQDAMVGPILVFMSVAAAGGGGLAGTLGITLFKSLIVVILIYMAERTLLRPLLRWAAGAGSPEVLTGATLLLVLGVGGATEQAGLSMALGAFLAGIMVADTEFRHQVAADIQPFRGLFLGLFFMTVGMRLDIGLAAERAPDLVMLVVGLMVLKAIILTGLARLFGLPWERAFAVGGLLSQGSEFAFIVLGVAAAGALLPTDLAQLLIAAVGITMAVTAGGTMLVRRLTRARLRPTRSALGKLEEEGGELSGHVVVAGFGQVGKAVARHLAKLHIPIVVLDMHPNQVSASRARGLPVFYGDAARADVLRAAHLDRAQALVVAVPEASTAERITAVARQAFPRLYILTRVPDPDWVQRVRKAGASAVVVEGLTTAVELAERVVLVWEAPDAA